MKSHAKEKSPNDEMFVYICIEYNRDSSIYICVCVCVYMCVCVCVCLMTHIVDVCELFIDLLYL